MMMVKIVKVEEPIKEGSEGKQTKQKKVIKKPKKRYTTIDGEEIEIEEVPSEEEIDEEEKTRPKGVDQIPKKKKYLTKEREFGEEPNDEETLSSKNQKTTYKKPKVKKYSANDGKDVEETFEEIDKAKKTTTKVIVQGLKGGVRRQELSLRRVTLTDDKINIKRGAKREEVLKAIEEYKLEDKYKKSTFAKKVEKRAKRASLTDFDRFKVMRLRQKRAVLRHMATKGKKGGKKRAKEQKSKKK